MHDMLCEKCGEKLRMEKIGVKVRYGLYDGYFNADLWKCPSCGHGIITGFSTEVFDPDAEVDYDFSER